MDTLDLYFGMNKFEHKKHSIIEKPDKSRHETTIEHTILKSLNLSKIKKLENQQR
ncbi:MAG: hypothetical protein ACFFA0_15935 [Promethearchaeota archaeon]